MQIEMHGQVIEKLYRYHTCFRLCAKVDSHGLPVIFIFSYNCIPWLPRVYCIRLGLMPMMVKGFLLKLKQMLNQKWSIPYCCAVKIKNNLQIWTTVGHIPREISRFVFYFIQDEGGHCWRDSFIHRVPAFTHSCWGTGGPLKIDLLL